VRSTRKWNSEKDHAIPRLSEQSPSNRHSSDKKNATKPDLKVPISARLFDSEVLSIFFAKDIVSQLIYDILECFDCLLCVSYILNILSMESEHNNLQVAQAN